MSFAFPIALLGFLAVPALVAIYVLRSRHRRVVVSSLMLWVEEGRQRAGGRVWDRLQTSLIFFIELCAIILLTVAAAGPIITARASQGTLAVVLDDSFSMLAGSGESPRTRAAAALKGELKGSEYQSVKLVLAGEIPLLLGEAGAPDQAEELLDRWKCSSPLANLEEATAFAFTLAGSRGRVLVLSDHPPAETSGNDRLRWLSFGQDKSNIAFVNATRTERAGGERCLLEIANLSSATVRKQVVVECCVEEEPRELKRYELNLDANARTRIIFNVDAAAGALRARLPDDALEIDNQVLLLPDRGKALRVGMRFSNERLKALVDKAVLATGLSHPDGSNPQLLFTDSLQIDDAGPETWIVQLVDEPDARSYVGPFVIDRGHRLAEGLSLNGVVWAGGSGTLAGRPLISAGDVPLLTEVERGESQILRWRLRPEISTLQDTPAWPVLIWNLLNWRGSQAPGFEQSNVRLGSSAALNLAPASASIALRSPDGETREFPSGERTLSIKAETAGVYELTAGNDIFKFASNALSLSESDLTRCSTGRWDGWSTATEEDIHEKGMAWVFLLIGLILLAAHLALSSRPGAGAGRV
jgi:hypothetical protein